MLKEIIILEVSRLKNDAEQGKLSTVKKNKR